MSEDALIIFLDLVGYSKHGEVNQKSFFVDFQREVHYSLYQEINAFERNVVLIPTGDGMIISLLSTDEPRVRLAATFRTVVRIFDWVKGNAAAVRCAIHAGAVNLQLDINRANNLVGNAINDTERMLQGADHNTIVVSKDFFDRFLRRPDWQFGIEYELDKTSYRYRILDEDHIFDKHSQPHRIMSLSIGDRPDHWVGEAGRILSKYFTRIYSSEYSKLENLTASFIPRLEKADEIHLYGIYHPNSPKLLEHVRVNSSRRVTIWIYFANDLLEKDLFAFFGSDDEALRVATKKGSLESIIAWAQKEENAAYVSLRVFEYSDFPSAGASLLDPANSDKGFIHVSHYLRGVVPARSPYLEIEWKTRTKPPLYESYYAYFRDNIYGKGKVLFNKDFGGKEKLHGRT